MKNMEIQMKKTDYRFSDHIISAIIPVYNAEDSICNALDSIKKQDIKDVEIVIVNDGSTDRTAIEVLSYMDRNPNMDILYISQENSGPGAARNIGLNYASGRYISFLDSDDFIPKHAYRQFINVVNKWNCDVVIGSYMRRIDDGSWYVPQEIKKICEDNDGKNLAGEYPVVIKNPSLWNRLYRREFLEKNNIRFLNENHGEDVIFNLDVIRCAEKVYTTDSVCYYYSKRENKRDSVSTSWSEKNTLSHIRAISTYMLYFDGIGDVYSEAIYLRTEITYLMNGIRTVEDRTERNNLYECIMRELKKYIGNKKYEDFISNLLGVDLETAVLVPFDVYLMYKQLNWQQKAAAPSNNAAGQQLQNNKEVVLQQFAKGQIGFKYILKYIKAWIKFKIFH